MFLQEVNYKMEVNEVQHNHNQRILLKKEEFSQEEKRQAFKKKLRKYSGKIKPEDFEQLP